MNCLGVVDIIFVISGSDRNNQQTINELHKD